MCGIVGYVGFRKATPILLDSLRRLEYRGYDSAGVAVKENGELKVVKAKGQIKILEGMLPAFAGKVGIGHTRWATHGRPTDQNAHPFYDCTKKFAMVHNGIIENFMEVKEQLLKEGHKFTSETDTEVISHLVEKHYDGDLLEALRKTVWDLKGAYAIAVLCSEKNEIVIARNESPLIIGLGRNENYVASDVPALLKETNKVIYVLDGELALVNSREVKVFDRDGKSVQKDVATITWNLEDAEKGGFEHFMLKEIFETPNAVHNTILGRLTDMDQYVKHNFSSVKFIACGTSYHAALVGKYVFEDLVKVPSSAEMASEYRYSSASVERPLTILISQSGETADTLAAAREARRRGCVTIAITNYMGSTLTREVTDVLYTRAGLEIGVAATKTFTTQLAAIYLLALKYGLRKNVPELDRLSKLRTDMRAMPRWVENVLDNSSHIQRWPRCCRRRGTCSSLGGTSTILSRWRAPSSSRRYPIYMPKATRRESSSTGRLRSSRRKRLSSPSP